MTGVATQLGLERFEVPSVTISSWRSWSVKDDRLAGLDDPHHLRRWLQQGGFAEVNAALAALGALAHVESGGDLNAAVTLAWAVLPGMTRLANQLRQVSADIDHAVAARLWLAVRTVPATRHSVAARLAYRVRAGVLHDELHDPRTVPVGDRLPVIRRDEAAPPASAAQELLELLDWACDTSVIDQADRELLLGLVHAASDDMWLRRDTRGGLMGEPSQRVARDLGVSVRTVQRRAGRCVDVLSAATNAYLHDLDHGRQRAA